MTAERWRQVEELYHSALEREGRERSDFIDSACANDNELRRELESLLAHEPSDSALLDPIWKQANEALHGFQGNQHLVPGTLIGSYEILSLLGEGGMGAVYKARDRELKRLVALKVLPPELTGNSERKRRFVQEARSASALNHPNIVTIYEIGSENGVDFISMELVQGTTLDHIIEREGMPLGEALRCAVQIADALAKAHAAGVVHRDLKPANIMITQDHLIKVVDFGLAKLMPLDEIDQTDTLGRPSEMQRTEEGMILGTVAYMSPEQAEGKSVDARSDVFSFGSVLYEMITGHRAFQGDTKLSVLAAILHEEPRPVRDLKNSVDPELNRIVIRCLQKQPFRRFQTAADARVALLEVLEESESTRRVAGRRFAALHTKRIAFVITLPVVIVVAVLAILWNRVVDTRDSFQRVQITRVYAGGDAAQEAAISADGRYIAHGIIRGGGQSIWLRQIATGTEIQIIPPGPQVTALAFSRDASYIFYQAAGRLYRVPAIGGPAQGLGKFSGRVAISPDNLTVGFQNSSHDGKSSIWVANIDGTQLREIASRKSPDFFNEKVAWSPDGSLLACGAGSAGPHVEILIVRINGGLERTISISPLTLTGSMTWLPNGRGLLLNGFEKDHIGTQIWYLPYPVGAPRRITNDLSSYSSLSVTGDSISIASVQFDSQDNIWIYSQTDGAAHQIPLSTSRLDGVSGMSWTPDGKLVYTSDLGGHTNIWIMDSDSSNRRQLTTGASVSSNPRVTSDRRFIYFHSNRTGTYHVWRMDIEGANQTQVTYGEEEIRPEPSPDGKWLLYGVPKAGGLWKMPTSGGEQRRIENGDVTASAISPDGKYIAFNYQDDTVTPPKGTGVVPFEGGAVRRFPIFRNFTVPKWSADGAALYYVADTGGASNVWKQPINGSPPAQVTHFTSGSIGQVEIPVGVSRDGRFAFTRGGTTSDVILIRDLR